MLYYYFPNNVLFIIVLQFSLLIEYLSLADFVFSLRILSQKFIQVVELCYLRCLFWWVDSHIVENYFGISWICSIQIFFVYHK